MPKPFRAALAAMCKGHWSRAIGAMMMLCAITGVRAGELQVAAANSDGNSLYDLTLSSSGLVTGSSPLNSDGSKHGSFQSLAYLPNAVTGTLDLIVADAEKQTILRYSGPKYGTSTTIYSWPGLGKGPAEPRGLSVDTAGDIFVVSSSCGSDGTPSLWVLPVNKQGGYGAPVLIDNHFGGVKTSSLAETLVAGTATKLWNVGDLLVLVGDSFDARVIVYSEKAIGGVIANPSKPLGGPTSTAIPWSSFAPQSAAPVGMDLWPADAKHGTSLLFTTTDGRILRFDTSADLFDPNFASGLGSGLAQIKAAANAGVEYAFVAQSLSGNHGQILQFESPPSSGSNKPVASFSSGVSNPIGLAVTSSSSEPATSCVSPEPACTFLGGALTLQFSGPGASKISGNILEQACVVPSDPRVTVAGTTWSCNGATLDVSTLCPGFPSTILPGSLCGHSGSSGAGFVVVKGTALGVDPVDNDTQIVVQSNINAILPGPLNQNCAPVAAYAWAPRPDLPGNEGTIVEDAVTPFFIDLTGGCDEPEVIQRGASMASFGLALNSAANGLPTGLPGFIDTKFTNLLNEVKAASITPTVAGNLDTYIGNSETAFNSGVAGAPNGFSCAAYWADYADTYLRANLGAFSSNLIGTSGNPNPAFDISGRLANLFLSIETRVAGLPANPTWPPANVPACVTLTATPTAVPAGTGTTLSWTALGVPTGSSCTLSGVGFNNLKKPATGTVTTGNLTAAGSPYSYELTCPGTGTATSFDTATVKVTAATTVVVPTVVGNAVATAESTLTSAGLAYSVTQQASTTVPIGSVISQSPAAGVSAAKGSTVNLVVSSGEAVPNVVGQTQAVATSTLTTAGFKLGSVTPQASTTVAVGYVISQTPASGASANGGSPVNLVISSGETVPGVVGQTQTAATSTLTAAGFVLGSVTQQASTTVAVGYVISQTPAPGASATDGSPVNLVVSSGVTVPNVVGATYTQAYNALTAADLSVSGVTFGASSTIAVGDIVSENPVAGSNVNGGTPVALVESNGPAASIAYFSSPEQNTVVPTPTVVQGNSVPLNWSATGNSCELVLANIGTTPNVPLTGSSYASPALTQLGMQQIELACLGGGAQQSETDQSIDINVVSPVINSFTATPTNATTGSSVTLTWTTTEPTSTTCTLSASDGTYTTPTAVAATGSAATGTLTTTGTYTATLTCPNVTSPATLSVTVTSPNPLYNPQGSAFSPTSGNLYVTNLIADPDQPSGEILVYTPGASGLIQQTALTIGPVINATTTLEYPVALAFDASGNLYVADAGTNQVLVFALSASGTPTLLNTIVLPVLYSQYYSTPAGIAVDSQGYIYVACNTGGEIAQYLYVYQSLNASTPLTSWTGDTTTPFGWGYLLGVAVDGSGTNLLVGNSSSSAGPQVVSYTLTELQSVATNTSGGSNALTPGMVITPPSNGDSNAYPDFLSIAVDSSGNIYVAATGVDYNGNALTYPYAVASYNAAGTQINPATTASSYLKAVPPGQGNANPPLNGPAGLAVDPLGNLYVSNTQNNTIDVYSASTGDYQYDFLPLITLTLTQAANGYTLTWTSLGILPANASCTLTTSDGVYQNATESPQNSTGVPLNYGYSSATLSCPGAIALSYEPGDD